MSDQGITKPPPRESLRVASSAQWYYNAILAIECLVEDFGWDAVIAHLVKEATTASDERLDEVEELLDAAITVNEGKGQLLVL